MSFPVAILDTFSAVTVSAESESVTCVTVVTSKTSQAAVAFSRRSIVGSAGVTFVSSPSSLTLDWHFHKVVQGLVSRLSVTYFILKQQTTLLRHLPNDYCRSSPLRTEQCYRTKGK